MQARQHTLKFAVLAALAAASFSTAQAATFAAPTNFNLQLSTDLIDMLGSGTTFSGVGGATYNISTRTLTEGLTSVSMTNGTAADLIGAGASAAGLSLSSGADTISITGFSYSNATKSLSAVLSLNGVQKYSGVFLTSSSASVSESFNGALGTGFLSTGQLMLTSSASSALIAAFGLPSFYASMATGLNFGNLSVDVTGPIPAVPEPSTYALMGLGLVGVGFAARRRRAA